MKLVLLAFSLLFTAPVMAKVAAFTCRPKAFICDGGQCRWRLMNSSEQIIALDLDPRYPTPGYPHELWRGHFRAESDRHLLNLNVNYSEADGFSTTATLQQGSVFTETSGGPWVDISLRTFDYGRGFICTGFHLLEDEQRRP